MFGPDFYPTPKGVIEKMCEGIPLDGKTILEPSAGSGNIVGFLLEQGAQVIACENHPDLARIVASKCPLIAGDFLSLSADEVSHIDCIIMNPPFSAEEKHIMHAWEIAPGGCQIVSLFNHDSFHRGYSKTTNQLKIDEIINMHGFEENLGKVFSTAERETKIDIGMLTVFKPHEDPEVDFASYFELDEQYENQQDGIIKYNQIQELVSRYVGAVKIFDQTIEASRKMNELINPIHPTNIMFGAFIQDRYSVQRITKDQFKKELQKKAWRVVFDKFNLAKFVTSSIKSQLDSFIMKQENFPFTMNNIFRMVEMIIGTNASRMDKVLVEAFDHICSLSASNSTAGEKWKTNSNYKINRRFIDDYITHYEPGWISMYKHVTITHHSHTRIDDIQKALCYLTGKDYNKMYTIESFVRMSDMEWGQWYNWEPFFRIRGYKKGTMHFEFIDENVWQEFNLRVAKIKGWQLPGKTDNKKKGTERAREMGVDLFSQAS